MSVYIFGIKIYTDKAITDKTDIGLYAVTAANSVFRWAEAPMLGSSDAWATNILARDGIGDIIQKASFRYGGGVVHTDGVQIKCMNTAQLALKMQELDVFPTGYKLEIIESYNATLTTIFTGAVEDIRWDEKILTMQISAGFRHKRRANIATIIDSTTATDPAETAQNKIFPVSFGTTDPENGLFFNVPRVNDKYEKLTVLHLVTNSNPFDREPNRKQQFSVDASTNLATCSYHGYNTGDIVFVHAEGTLPTGLAEDTAYYIIWVSDSTFYFAASASDAASSTPINITSNGETWQVYWVSGIVSPMGSFVCDLTYSSATLQYPFRIGSIKADAILSSANANTLIVGMVAKVISGENEGIFREITAAQTSFESDIPVTFTANTSTNQLSTGSAHAFEPGEPIIFSTTGTLPAPLIADKEYFAAPLGSSVLYVCDLKSDPFGGTAIDITSIGSGIHTVGRYRHKSSILLTFKDYFPKILSGTNDGTQSIIEIYSIDRNFKADTWPCGGFVGESGTSNDAIFVESDQVGVLIPPSGTSIEQISPDKNTITISGQEGSDTPNDIKTFHIISCNNLERINTGTLKAWRGAIDVLDSDWKLSACVGLYIPVANSKALISTDATFVNPELAIDRQKSTYCEYVQVLPASGSTDYIKCFKMSMPNLPFGIRFTKAYLGLHMWQKTLYSVYTNSKTYFRAVGRRISGDTFLIGEAEGTQPIPDVVTSGTPGGAFISNLPDYYWTDSPTTTNNKDFYYQEPADSDTRYDLISGYQTYDLGIGSREEFENIQDIGLFFVREMGSTYEEQDETKIYGAAIIFETSTKIGEAVFA